jgi:hypothetical protein
MIHDLLKETFEVKVIKAAPIVIAVIVNSTLLFVGTEDQITDARVGGVDVHGRCISTDSSGGKGLPASIRRRRGENGAIKPRVPSICTEAQSIAAPGNAKATPEIIAHVRRVPSRYKYIQLSIRKAVGSGFMVFSRRHPIAREDLVGEFRLDVIS